MACARLLDFGGSSGRVARVMKAAYPSKEVYVVDPNKDTIDWALGAYNATLVVSQSPQFPPTRFGAGFFDCAYAICIWSHYAEPSAKAWLQEMARIIKPGGYLVFTAHGLQSMRFYSRNRLVSSEQLQETQRLLAARGHAFYDSFGERGDWGVINPKR